MKTDARTSVEPPTGRAVGLSATTMLNWFLCRHLPPVMRRRIRNYMFAVVGAGVAAVGWMWACDNADIRHGWWARALPLAVGFSPVLVFLPIMTWSSRRLRRNFQAAGGRLCTHCGYDVSTLGEHGTCPECGGAFDAEKDDLLWLAARMRADRR